MKPALLFNKSANGLVNCLVCPHKCKIKPDKTGICNVRKNINGELYSLNFDKIAALNFDPIEKKPLYHFLPDSLSLSIAAMGCNLNCRFCQNHSLSMVKTENDITGENITPQKIVEVALRNNSRSISYTYTEPTIYFELMYETARLAKENNIKNVMVTNGFISNEALEIIIPLIDGANIDLKSFSEEFYHKYCSAKLAPVLNTITRMKKAGVWVEVTTLLIPDLNTDPEEITRLISFIAELDNNIPWHVSRFFPHYKITDLPPTDPKAIYFALDKAAALGLNFLYAGNTTGKKWSDTSCPACNSDLIQRTGYSTKVVGMDKQGVCRNCGLAIPGVWNG